ncbi:hypothetical protein TrVE_jg254 [Triparma verrucosa]|uniref:Phosphatidylinositol-glycan biosynthesis class W protein n=1 Tax=Triparma verrucosa TaxID=1606542 RepID=A0A9W7FM96_9STRA|nr:hypothetical protein TrVE_jg254 [Triparma verrucosa]
MSKAEREAFVHGFNGSTAFDVLTTTLVPPLIGVLLTQELFGASRSSRPSSRPMTAGMLVLRFTVEFAIVILPAVFLQMRLGLELDAAHARTGLLGLAFLIFFSLRLLKQVEKRDRIDVEMPSRKIVTLHRSAVSVLTYVAILAVDFRAFPREFCKCETEGYGLMDLGTGSFVFASGLCSPWSRGKGRSDKGLLRSFLKSLPLFVLGAVRCAATKGLDYQEHVSEYGTHWNFFFTLCAINILSEGLLGAGGEGGWSRRGGILLAFSVYQFALTQGLQKYVEREGRTSNIFDMNREGLLGTLGYLSLHVVAEFIGRVAFWRKDVEKWGKWEGGNVLTGVVVLAWVVFLLLTDDGCLNLAVSRRTTNAAYVAWAIAVNASLLLGLAAIVRPNEQSVMIFEAINRNGLVVFLIANLLTGAVNLSIDTLAVGNLTAIKIVAGYMGLVCGVAMVLDKFDLTIKL